MTDPAALVPFLDRQVRALPWTRPPEPTGILSPLHEARDRFPFVALTTVRFAPLLRKHYGAGWRHIDGDEGALCGRGRDHTLSGPAVLAGEEDALPAERGDVGEKRGVWSRA